MEYLKKELLKVSGNREFQNVIERLGYITVNKNDVMIGSYAKKPTWSNWTGYEFEHFSVLMTNSQIIEFKAEAKKCFGLSDRRMGEELGFEVML